MKFSPKVLQTILIVVGVLVIALGIVFYFHRADSTQSIVTVTGPDHSAPATVVPASPRGYLSGTVTLDGASFGAAVDISNTGFFMELLAADGTFNTPLPVGNYILTVHSRTLDYACPPVSISIAAHATATPTIACTK